MVKQQVIYIAKPNLASRPTKSCLRTLNIKPKQDKHDKHDKQDKHVKFNVDQIICNIEIYKSIYKEIGYFEYKSFDILDEIEEMRILNAKEVTQKVNSTKLNSNKLVRVKSFSSNLNWADISDDDE